MKNYFKSIYYLAMFLSLCITIVLFYWLISPPVLKGELKIDDDSGPQSLQAHIPRQPMLYDIFFQMKGEHSNLKIYENGKELLYPDTRHHNIRVLGGGRYDHYQGDFILLSPIEPGSKQRHQSFKYTFKLTLTPRPILYILAFVMFVLTLVLILPKKIIVKLSNI